MSQNFRKVLPDEYDKETLWAAMLKGLLYTKSPEKVCKENVIKEIRMYVKQLHPFVTYRFRSHVDDIWERIFSCDEMMEILIPNPKPRKFRAFNKYNTIRIIGVLREMGVYQPYKHQTFITQLEHSQGDNSYRSFMGRGIEQRHLLKKIQEIVAECEA